MDAMAAAVNDKTKLVAVSLVSTTNGFQHDLKRVSDIAHAHGAYVYADIVHGAGTVPLDLRASGVDFAASSSYKWLMGDFGLGFLYVRREIQERFAAPGGAITSSAASRPTFSPTTAPGPQSPTTRHPGCLRRFAMGTYSWTGVIQLEYSLAWLNQLGVPAIQTWRQPLVNAVQTELRRRGYEPMTPVGLEDPVGSLRPERRPHKTGRPLEGRQRPHHHLAESLPRFHQHLQRHERHRPPARSATESPPV